MKEIEEFVTAFYEAHTKNGIDSLGNYIEDKENLDIYVVAYEAAFAYGFQKYDNIDVDVYPLYQDEYWMTHIYHDMVIEDSDVRLPGMVAYLIHKGEDGNYYIIIEDVNSVEVPEDVTAEIKRILQTDEVIEKVSECNAEYNEIISENQEAYEWVCDVASAINQAKADAVTDREEAVRAKQEGTYIVQKGDCLWNIAESELGDGMYWTQIYRGNQDVIGDNPDLLFVGIKLRIDK